jgi:hypothetical protein
METECKVVDDEECCGCGSLVEPEPEPEPVTEEACGSCSGCGIPDINIHDISKYIPTDQEDDGDID